MRSREYANKACHRVHSTFLAARRNLNPNPNPNLVGVAREFLRVTELAEKDDARGGMRLAGNGE